MKVENFKCYCNSTLVFLGRNSDTVHFILLFQYAHKRCSRGILVVEKARRSSALSVECRLVGTRDEEEAVIRERENKYFEMNEMVGADTLLNET